MELRICAVQRDFFYFSDSNLNMLILRTINMEKKEIFI